MINKKELMVLDAIKANAYDCSGGDYAMSEELHYYLDGFSPKEISGYVSILQKKGLIVTDGVQIEIKKEEEK